MPLEYNNIKGIRIYHKEKPVGIIIEYVGSHHSSDKEYDD